MSLTDTINNTNKQKENVKQVATQIDNKLIELGGERATDLADVVNKMGTVIGQYKKFAILNPNREFKGNSVSERKTYTINLNVDFIPKKGFLNFIFKPTSTTGYNNTQHIVEIGNSMCQPGIHYYVEQYKITINAKLTNKTLNITISVSYNGSSSLATTIDVKLLKATLIG